MESRLDAAKQKMTSALDEVTELLKTNSNGDSILAIAADYNHSDIIRQVLLKALNVTSKPDEHTKKLKSALLICLQHAIRRNTTGVLNSSILLIAARENKPDLLSFVIQQCWEMDKQHEIVAQLTCKDDTGKNILHYSVFYPNNCVVIRILIDTANRLQISNYINLMDDECGYTALHFATRYSALENMIALIELKADINQLSAPTSNSKYISISVIDTLKLRDYKEASPILAHLIMHTDHGRLYFENRHGKFDLLNNQGLMLLIEIDVLSGSHSVGAQLLALQKWYDLKKNHYSEETADVIFSIISYINCAKALDAVTLPHNQNRQVKNEASKEAEDIISNQLYEYAISFTQHHFDNKVNLIDDLIKASLLCGDKTPKSQQRALYYYNKIVEYRPDITKHGLMKLNIALLSTLSEFTTCLYTKSLIYASAKTELEAIKKLGSIHFFEKRRHDKKSTIRKFLENLDSTETISSVCLLINDLPDEKENNSLKTMLRKILETLLRNIPYSAKIEKISPIPT